ncbi:hypothetical protein [Hyalangium minutum]|uniref:Uncharacterized protein n=1 Tax=Hyalangium minutum TaxID=394096 RepID=A0A085WM29_9BACT|nr:hypothetical protein [Hyalangium minutum]KFE68742.1 hypothetical protein DB31_7979 [Hyalangium minutum]
MRLAPVAPQNTSRISDLQNFTKPLAPQSPSTLPPDISKKLGPGPLMDTFSPRPLLQSQGAQQRTTQGSQLNDIASGVRSGSITGKEAQGLLAEQQKLANSQKTALADGQLSLGEKLKLGLEQARAGQNIDSAKGNSSRDVFAAFDKTAQRQAGQIDQIANGRARGTITHSEAGNLLGDQARIAGRRDLPGALNDKVTDLSQNRAQQDITRHSKPGTQFDLKSFQMRPVMAGVAK